MKSMKKIIFSLFLVSISILVSCSSNDSNDDINPNTINNTDTSLIIGKWNMTEYRIDNMRTLIESSLGNGVNISSILGKDFTTTITFSENPNNVVSSGSHTVIFTPDTSNVDEQFEVQEQTFNVNGEWSLIENQLTFITTDNSNPNLIATVTELTDKILKFTVEINEVRNPEEGVTTTQTGTAVYSFTKE